MRKLRLAALLALPLLAGLTPASGQSSFAKICPGGQSEAVLRSGDFTIIARPPGIEQISTFAAGGPDGQVVLASDGRLVMRSIDGGCRWKQAFDAGNDLGEVGSKVVQLLIPEGSDSAYMLTSGVAEAVAPQLLLSADRGENWQPIGEGLPSVGRFKELVAAPGNEKALYLVTGPRNEIADLDPGVTGALYGSDDGGATWQQRGGAGSPIESLAVDPVRPKDVYVVRTNHAVEKSENGGVDWAPLSPKADGDEETPDHLWREIQVSRKVPAQPIVTLFATNGRNGAVTNGILSADGGRSWGVQLDTRGLGPAGGAMFGRSTNQLFWLAGSPSTAFHGPGIYALDKESVRYESIDALDLRSLEEPQQVLVTKGGPERYRAIFARRDAPGEDPPLPDMIVRYDPPAPDPTDVLNTAGPCKNESVPRAADVLERPPSFSPGALSLRVEPGSEVRTSLAAALPPQPSPLDVYFLIDHSTSMDPAIEGLFCSVARMARELPRRGIDTRMGLGAYSDYFLSTYKRHVDVSEPGPHLSQALKELFTFGGVHEPMRSALYQSATGAGLDTTARDPNAGPAGGKRVERKVAPGQQANFRPNALKIALVIGDEPYENDTEGEPARDAVVKALRERGILAVGVRVRTTLRDALGQSVNLNDPLNPDGQDHSLQRQQRLQSQMEYFARATGALAPRGGVDCDGQGAPDIPAGDPLVCSILENGIQRSLDETLITLLRGIEDRRDVRFVPARTSGLDVAVEDGEFADIDVREKHDLAATGVISCSESQAGKRYSIAFDVMVGDRRVGRLPGTVQCGAIVAAAAPKPRRPDPPDPARPATADPAPAPKPPPATAPAPQPQPGVAAAPPPPPPAPAPAGSVQLNPASAQAPSSAAAPAPGSSAAAAQEQQKLSPKLALIGSEGESEAPLAGSDLSMTGKGDFAMTARRPAPIPPAALITLGIGSTALFGYGAHRVAARRRRRDLDVVRAD